MSKLNPPLPPLIPNHTKGGELEEEIGGGKRKYEEVEEEERGPRVPRSRGPKDKDISKSYSNTSLTLKKVHLVFIFVK